MKTWRHEVFSSWGDLSPRYLGMVLLKASWTREATLELGMSKVTALASWHGSGLFTGTHAGKGNGMGGLVRVPSLKFWHKIWEFLTLGWKRRIDAHPVGDGLAEILRKAWIHIGAGIFRTRMDVSDEYTGSWKAAFFGDLTFYEGFIYKSGRRAVSEVQEKTSKSNLLKLGGKNLRRRSGSLRSVSRLARLKDWECIIESF